MYKVIVAILLIEPPHRHQVGLMEDQPEAKLVQGLHQLQLRDNKTIRCLNILCLSSYLGLEMFWF